MFNVNVFSKLMQQHVTIEPFTAYDAYGVASYGSAVSYEAAVVGKIERVVTVEGQEVPSRQTVYLKSNVMMRPEDRITLSSGDVGSTESYATQPAIVSIGRYPMGTTAGCTVVYLK